MRRAAGPGSPGRAVTQFALAGLVAIVAVGLIGVEVLRQAGTREAERDAKQVTRLAGEGIVGPLLTPSLLAGDRRSIARLDRVVRRSVIRRPTVRVKVWDDRGRVVYSDEHRLIGSRYPLGTEERRALDTGGVDAELSDLERPENRFERSQRKLLEVYLGVRSPTGRRLLFETYERFGSISASGRRLWLAFAPALLLALALLAVLQVPLARSLVRRVQRAQGEREKLLRRAVDASQLERRRLARDLHDGAVQTLAGVSYSLAGVEGEAMSPTARATVERAAHDARQSIRELRTMLVDLYPPSLEEDGLEPALADLAAPLTSRAITAEVRVEPGLELSYAAQATLFRGAQEALRNVVAHAHAETVQIDVSRVDGRGVLVVTDDGRGFDPPRLAEQTDEHFGLRLLADLTRDAGGDFRIDSRPGNGTRVRLEVPV